MFLIYNIYKQKNKQQKMPNINEINLIKGLNEKQRRSHFFIKHYNDLYNKIMVFNKTYLSCDNFTQILYNYINDIKKSNQKCEMCENDTKFKGFNAGYNKYCSKKCVMSDKKIIDDRNKKTINTCMEKYGVTNASKLQSVIEKAKITSLEKYGASSYTKTSKFKEDIIKNNQTKYGVDWYLSTDDFRNKSKIKCMEKYGVDHHTKNSEYKNNIESININKWGVKNYAKTSEFYDKMKNYHNSGEFKMVLNKRKNHIDEKIINYYKNYNNNYHFIKIQDDEIFLICKKCKCEFTINKQLYYLRSKNNMVCCTDCNPKYGKNISSGEKEILIYIRSVYDGEIIENYKYEKMEIDIYLPDLKIGFEYNGLWYHSELFKKNNYHLDKLNFFSEISINIFMIWEDEWEYKSNIIKSMILNKIGKIENKIMARKCKVEEIFDNKVVNAFIEDNHIQGKINSLIKIGLYYNNELLCVMTFGNLRKSLGKKSKQKHYELLRFCSKINTSVVGGASKILSFFIKKYNPSYILSYSNKCYSIGDIYYKIGFIKSKDTIPNYYWCKNKLRYNRFSFRKDILVKNGYDSNLTESEIMNGLKYFKVYNCGNYKFEMYL